MARKDAINSCFGNNLNRSLWTKFQAATIIQNLKDRIPEHQQAELLAEFVKAGYIKA